MKPWYRNSTLQMDDGEMEWLQSQDPASCAVWEWLKADCQKRGSNEVRKLSERDISSVSKRLGIDSPRFSQISQRLQEVGWISQNTLRGWSKWQSSRTPEEDAARKQIEYYKSKAEQLTKDLEKVSQSLPKSPEVSLRGEERRGEERRSQTLSVVGGIEEFRNKLSVAFNRKDQDRWTCEEEQLLCLIFKRSRHDQELTELLNCRDKKGKYFPQSIVKLLNSWTSALDASRNEHANGNNTSAFKEYGTAEQSEARRIAELAELTKMNTQPRKQS